MTARVPAAGMVVRKRLHAALEVEIVIDLLDRASSVTDSVDIQQVQSIR